MAMSNQEKDNFGNQESYDAKKLESLRAEQQDKLKKDLERSAEAGPDDLEEARHDALEKATALEKEPTKEKQSSPAERRGPLTRREKDASFDKTMAEVRSHMSAPSKTFSKLIHNKTVERASDIVGSTIARPNAILSGSVFAFIFTLVIYLIANHNGYALSGSETIASFAVGWVVGLIIDYIRVLVGSKRS